MAASADRMTGAFFLIFGVILYVVIIPIYVEEVDGGWLKPATVPNAIAVVLALCGALLMLKPTQHRVQPRSEFLFAGLYFALLAVGLFVMSYAGFLYSAPVIALAVMLLIGERRLFWLAMGVAGMPLAIWFLVARVLERSLP